MDKLKKQKTQNNGQKHKETDRLKWEYVELKYYFQETLI